MEPQKKVPDYFGSPLISAIKELHALGGSRRGDFSPTMLNVGRITFKLPRHFGFCFGVKNAIETAYKALLENPGKRVFLLSEMIHNPHVNEDLKSKGVRFLRTPQGEKLIPFSELRPEDIVIIPAFGTSLELLKELQERNVKTESYDTTCPFVKKVCRRAEELGKKGFTVIIHGKYSHEETQATFSHAAPNARCLIIKDLHEAQLVADAITGRLGAEDFMRRFAKRSSPGFLPTEHLARLGVVNQTTMLASETHALSELLKGAVLERYGAAELKNHFADTSDTLCYATEQNQNAVHAVIESGGDLALVVGGYNSSNTFNLAKLCAVRMPTYYIKDEDEILDVKSIRHLDMSSDSHALKVTTGWLPADAGQGGRPPLNVIVVAGASCPDSLVYGVMKRVAAVMPS